MYIYNNSLCILLYHILIYYVHISICINKTIKVEFDCGYITVIIYELHIATSTHTHTLIRIHTHTNTILTQ